MIFHFSVLKDVSFFQGLYFISDLNIHVTGSQLLREVFELEISHGGYFEP